MGTTVTTNLGLIKPDINEKIKEDLPTYAGWPAQNAANSNVIDGMFRAASSTYAPTLTSTGVNPTLGAGGFITGKYIRVMPKMVLGHVLFYAGTAGFAAGTGNYKVSLPVAPSPQLSALTLLIPIGRAVFFDATSTVVTGNFGVYYDPPSSSILFRYATGVTWSGTTPVITANNDRMSMYFIYPTDVP